MVVGLLQKDGSKNINSMKFERNPRLINLLIRLVGKGQIRAVRLANITPKTASELTLRSILRYAKHTEYGKEHHFKEILQALTYEELLRRFHKYVTPNNYDNLRPYIERQKTGEQNVIVPGKPVMYATTSGTTTEPKWIPITKRYLKSVYGKMTRCWITNFVIRRPNTFAGAVMFVVGKDVEGYAPDGTVFGSVSGVTQRDAPSFIRKMYVSYPEIFHISDYTARNYALMRVGIERNVTLFLTPNPSTILELQNTVNEHLDDFITDIEQGTISDKIDIPEDIRKTLLSRLHPNPERAKELRYLKQQHEVVLPKHYWPDIQLLSTWKCGNTQIYVDKIKDYFPEDIYHQELGYFASECRFGLCMDNGLDSVLFPHFHFYEFVAEEDLDKSNPRFYQLHELEEGRRYCSYVTTFGGLYRYNMNDLIEVGPRYLNTPTVHMVQKINGIVSMTGEKLAEQQFIKAIRRTEKSTGLKTRFFVGFADVEESTYCFYYEFANSSVTQAQAEVFTQNVDEILKEENVEYKSKRDSFRLKDPITGRLINSSYQQFKRLCLSAGMRDGQFKVNLLMQDEWRHDKFKRLLIVD